MKNTFEKVGMLDIFLNENPSPTTTTFCALFDREKNIFTQTAFEALKSMSKMKTYKFLETNRAGKWKITFSGWEMCRTEMLAPN